jgi:hypothetical protein
MRLAAILTMCLALGGCLTTDEPAPAANTSASPAAGAAPATPDKPAAAPAQRRAAPAATRGSNPPPAPPPQPAATEPVDPVLEVRQTCWSQGNNNKSFKNIEARADWVNACIAEKMKALR